MGRNENIYGADKNSFAEGIASDALDTSMQGMHVSGDYWGSNQDERAVAKANVGEESVGPSSPKTPELKSLTGVTDGIGAGGGDSEKLLDPYPQMQRFPRHTKGPSTATDEGGGVKTPPPRNQTGKPGKVAGPVYNKKVS